MKYTIFALCLLMLKISSQAQNTQNTGVIVMIEDSITHHYFGSSKDDNFIQRYSATADFESFALDTALILLEQKFRKWNFCMMESDNFLAYEQNREKLNASDFRNFRANWFNTLKEKFEVDAILIIRNSTNFTDGIHWGDSNIKGYGIYNGSRRSHNNVFIQLEFLFFTSGRPLTHIHGPIYQRDKDYPRIDKQEELFEESDLLMIEDPLKQLIVNQIEGALNNANLLRGLR